MKNDAEKLNLKTFFFYYAPGKTAFQLKKIFDKNLQTFDAKKLSFTKLSHSEIAEIYQQSFSVFDINKPLLEINEDNDDSINLVYKGLLYDTYIVMDILYHR